VDYPLFFKRALNDLAEIIGHIAEDDAEAATRFGNSLLDHLDLLTRFPCMGGVIRKRAHVRKLVHSPILVYYTLQELERRIEVLHFGMGRGNQQSSEDSPFRPM